MPAQFAAMPNYDNKHFRPVTNTENGEVDGDTLFIYHQEGNILTCSYRGHQILSGQLIGIVKEDGRIDMRYHHINTQMELMTGTCISTPEILSDGRIRLHERWQWTSGDKSEGSSVLEEVRS